MTVGVGPVPAIVTSGWKTSNPPVVKEIELQTMSISWPAAAWATADANDVPPSAQFEMVTGADTAGRLTGSAASALPVYAADIATDRAVN